MDKMTISDWVALYAALLSSVLAIAGFLNWLFSGPRLTVTVFSPKESGSERVLLAIVSNSGNISVVVRELEISFRTARRRGVEIGKAVFNESTRWKPSVKMVPVENKPNTTREEPNVIPPNGEIRAPAMPVKEYDINKHWIRVAALPRNSNRRFVGWAAPSTTLQQAGASS